MAVSGYALVLLDVLALEDEIIPCLENGEVYEYIQCCIIAFQRDWYFIFSTKKIQKLTTTKFPC
jgi:hypothetical protein